MAGSGAGSAAGAGSAFCGDCGAALSGRYCAGCGQAAELDSTLWGLAHRLFHSITHMDGRLWRTLALLSLQPGMLTREYVEGRRTRYLAPGTLFLASAFLMFLAFNLAGPKPLVAACHAPTPEAALQRLELRVEAGLAAAEGPLAAPAAGGAAAGLGWIAARMPPALRQALGQAANNPQYLLLQLKQKAYKMGFLLVPLSLPGLWLLFGRLPGGSGYRLAILSLHSIAFMSVLLTAVLLLAAAGLPWQAALLCLLIVPPLHMFRHVQGNFGLGAWPAAWRSLLMAGVALATLVAFLLGVVALGLG